jgi:hypothetical protein
MDSSRPARREDGNDSEPATVMHGDWGHGRNGLLKKSE